MISANQRTQGNRRSKCVSEIGYIAFLEMKIISVRFWKFLMMIDIELHSLLFTASVHFADLKILDLPEIEECTTLLKRLMRYFKTVLL